ncbi:hypothetical protein EPUS_08324 [Endocarpon pusillum Z07020]|uniref:Uncharacterized protein n=1 Tax=Endocarpon pusillum (strain Z07020 / HMAS-L-300199) TaxID=1263415 RepID=U1HXF6_ENDPU|nr:uncharacterized protein EPUS_08324 [Endocarpon pusillum Z07020]ERF75510.1 hypothetical protein EPUS_08324 [Endocarpon pusillum Z07020]
MSDASEPLRGTGVPSSKPKQGIIYEIPSVVKSDLRGPKEVSKVSELALKQHFKCSTNKHQDDLVDEGYFSPSPTPIESEIEFLSGPARSAREVEEAPLTPQFAINDILLELPQIHVTDEKGEIEIIAPDDNEHGQLWDFARDKIARRMFIIRADRRTQHMESTFYSDLYPVRQHLNLLQLDKCLTLRPIRQARTESATFSAAYISYMNGQRSRAHPHSAGNGGEGSQLTDAESIVYESHTSNHITIITPIAPKVLLAVTGSISTTKEQDAPAQGGDEHNEGLSEDAPSTAATSPPASPPSPPLERSGGPNGFLEPPKSLLEELGSISEQLSSVLREEMGQMRWPDGA